MSRRLTIRFNGGSSSIDIIPAGLPVSQESIFLVNYILEHTARVRTICDLGTGSGLIALMMATALPRASITGMDIQENLILAAQRNAEMNGITDRTRFYRGDLRSGTDLPNQHSMDLVTANPPFRKTDTGKISPDPERSFACHEITASLADYTRAGSLVLKDKGIFAMVILPERLSDAIHHLRERRLEPARMRFIHHGRGYSASAVLVFARLNGRGGLIIDPPIFSHHDASSTSSG